MLDDGRTTSEIDGDSSDVVEGPVGDADLVDPTIANDLGADLEQLPSLDGPDGIGNAGAARVEPADASGS